MPAPTGFVYGNSAEYRTYCEIYRKHTPIFAESSIWIFLFFNNLPQKLREQNILILQIHNWEYLQKFLKIYIPWAILKGKNSLLCVGEGNQQKMTVSTCANSAKSSSSLGFWPRLFMASFNSQASMHPEWSTSYLLNDSAINQAIYFFQKRKLNPVQGTAVGWQLVPVTMQSCTENFVTSWIYIKADTEFKEMRIRTLMPPNHERTVSLLNFLLRQHAPL